MRGKSITKVYPSLAESDTAGKGAASSVSIPHDPLNTFSLRRSRPMGELWLADSGYSFVYPTLSHGMSQSFFSSSSSLVTLKETPAIS